MKKIYIAPMTEKINLITEGILYTTSPQQGSDDTGTLPIEAKPVMTEMEEWEEELEEKERIPPRFSLWED